MGDEQIVGPQQTQAQSQLASRASLQRTKHARAPYQAIMLPTQDFPDTSRPSSTVCRRLHRPHQPPAHPPPRGPKVPSSRQPHWKQGAPSPLASAKTHTLIPDCKCAQLSPSEAAKPPVGSSTAPLKPSHLSARPCITRVQPFAPNCCCGEPRLFCSALREKTCSPRPSSSRSPALAAPSNLQPIPARSCCARCVARRSTVAESPNTCSAARHLRRHPAAINNVVQSEFFCPVVLVWSS